jgi:hypothetical protein
MTFYVREARSQSLLFVWASGFFGPEVDRKAKQTPPQALVGL